MQTYAYGFPRIGKKREFKKTTEAFWKKDITEDQLNEGINKIEAVNAATYKKYVDSFPAGEMSRYDNMLDTALMLGVYEYKGADDYYELCRGKDALEMTKWFNTNYHYLVPNIKSAAFNLGWQKPKEAAERLNNETAYLIGPFTFLKMSKGLGKDTFKDTLIKLAGVYADIIKDFKEVHLDEPAFVLELDSEEIEAVKEAYGAFEGIDTKINVFTYYEAVDWLDELYKLPVSGIGLDFVNGPANIDKVKKLGFPEGKTLIAGVVNGRNIWRTDIEKTLNLIKELSKIAGELVISNAAPLYHLPVSLEGEKLDEHLLNKISFAVERLKELKILKESFEAGSVTDSSWNKDTGSYGVDESVKDRVKVLSEGDFAKAEAFSKRIKRQQEILGLPLFPTTTIGSYPQDKEVRSQRARVRKGAISQEDYKKFIEEKITSLIDYQDKLGLDVLVHGEFERTDMVEFFAEKLEGIATTKGGWIISYGTRGYRPPIIYGDVVRPQAMTVDEIKFAQSKTDKPVKGMLTGPVTIIAWSFCREDIPTEDVAYQLGLCLQDEVKDYEQAGIKIVQIDEPAFREKAPIKRKDWPAYFNWAIRSFNLASISEPTTQIHTHMCYSEFGEIISYIAKMDFDVISIEASRSRGDIIDDFKKVNFERQIGLGVWDIHSPAVPSVDDMEKVVDGALEVLPKENFWVNPDCGLKTRGWDETKKSLSNLVEMAKKIREKY